VKLEPTVVEYRGHEARTVSRELHPAGNVDSVDGCRQLDRRAEARSADL